MKSVFSVSEINSYVAKLLKGDYLLTHLSVKGEVSNFKEHSNGKCYFSLKDTLASIRVILPIEVRDRANILMQDGTEILISGRLYVNERSGDFCVYAAAVEETGVGKTYREFKRLKKKLDEEGLFDLIYKKSLTCPCLSVGVITSPTGAAVHDIISVIRRKTRSINIFIYPSLVQGEAAPQQLIEGVRFFNRFIFPDVIIIGRGGGSYEDLSAFNDEMLARSIFQSNIPVISAVGHQVDFTIADFVADVRAATPSHAAELVLQTTENFRNMISEDEQRLRFVYRKRLEEYRIILDQRLELLSKHDPIRKLEENRNRLQKKLTILQSLQARIIQQKRVQLNERYKRLIEFELLSPELSVVNESGKKILSIKEVEQGEVLKIQLKDGMISVQVLSREVFENVEAEKGV